MTPFRARARPATAGSDVGVLLTSAARLRWRAPELALLMADQTSVAAARAGAESVRLRAEVLAVFACNQLGRGAAAGGRAVRALRAAEQAGEETTERLIRVELAACAADASAPGIGLAVLRPVFDRVPSAPTARAAAMVTAADCLARLGGGPDVAALLDTADQLYDLSRSVEPDAVLLRRGVVHARLAAYHRRRGDHRAAEATARAGLALIDELADGELDTGQVSGSLTAELVLALLDGAEADRAQVAEAVLAAQPVLRRPARPAGAAAACWLRLALVSRVHLPAGRHALARRLLGEAAADAERNQLDVALAECRRLQTQLHETCAELGEALQSLRAAYLADRRWRDTAAELRTLLAAEFGPPPPATELRSALTEVLASHRAADGSVTLGRTDLARVGRHGRPGAASYRPRRSTPMIAGTVDADSRSGIPTDTLGDHGFRESATLRSLPPVAANAVQSTPPAVSARPAQSMPADASRRPASTEQSVPIEPIGQAPAPPPGRARPPRHAEAAVSANTTAPPDVLAGPTEPTRAAGRAGSAEAVRSAGPVGLTGLTPATEAAPTADSAGAAGVAGPAEGAGPAEIAVSEQLRAAASEQPWATGTADTPADHSRRRPDVPAEPREDQQQRAASEAEHAEAEQRPGTERLGGEQPPAEPLAGVDSDGPQGVRTGEPPVDTGSATGVAVDAEGGEPGSEADAPQRSPAANGHDRGTGRHRSDVAMADLLAEALLAYQNGRRSRLAAGTPSTEWGDTAPTRERPEASWPEHERSDAAEPASGAGLSPSAGGGGLPASAMGSEVAGGVEPPKERPKIRWIDLPRNLVWREPGAGGLTSG